MNILKFKNQIKEKYYNGCWGLYGYFIDCDETCNIVELCKKKTLKNKIKDYFERRIIKYIKYIKSF